MPVFTIRDPRSGRTVELRGDQPPTEDELEEIFASESVMEAAPAAPAEAPAGPTGVEFGQMTDAPLTQVFEDSRRRTVPEGRISTVTGQPYQPGYAAMVSPEERRSTFYEQAHTPPVAIPHIPEMQGAHPAARMAVGGLVSPAMAFLPKGPDVAAGAANVGVDFANFFMSPVGLATILGAKVPGVRRAIPPAFAVEMGRHVPEAAEAAGEATVQGTTQEMIQSLLGLGTQITLPGFLGAGTARPIINRFRQRGQPPVIRERTQDARQVKEAAEVYGDVRQRGEPAEGMPAEAGRQRVRPEAERVAEEAPVPLEKPLYRGTTLEQWEAIQRGEQPQSEYTTGGNTWATTSREAASGYTRAGGKDAVIIEYKGSAHKKARRMTDDPGDHRRQGPLRLEDVQRVTDGTGKVIYEAPKQAAKGTPSSERITPEDIGFEPSKSKEWKGRHELSSEDGKLVADFRGEGPIRIDEVIVDPAVQGIGIGSGWVKMVKRVADSQNRTVILEATPINPQSRAPLNRFYERLGFEKLSTNPETGNNIYGYRPRGAPAPAPSAAAPKTPSVEGKKVYRLDPGKKFTDRPRTMTEEEVRYLEEERSGIDRPIEIVEEGTPGQPFARGQQLDFMTINRETGTIVVNREPFQRWVDLLRERGIKEPQIRRAVRSRLAEEDIHLKTDASTARSYWDGLSRFEQAINRRRYAAETQDLTPTQLGHEALRFRMQQAMRMTPSEFAEMALAERITWEGITALEKSVRSVRETFTKAGKEQRMLFDRAMQNIEAAKAAIGGPEPSARIREEREPERKRLEDELDRPDAEIRITVQPSETFRGETMPGYVQVDKVIGGRQGEGTWSRTAPTLRNQGYELPAFERLPGGNYSLAEATRMLERESPPVEPAARMRDTRKRKEMPDVPRDLLESIWERTERTDTKRDAEALSMGYRPNAFTTMDLLANTPTEKWPLSGKQKARVLQWFKDAEEAGWGRQDLIAESILTWESFALQGQKELELARRSVPPLEGKGWGPMRDAMNKDIQKLESELQSSIDTANDSFSLLKKLYPDNWREIISDARARQDELRARLEQEQSSREPEIEEFHKEFRDRPDSPDQMDLPFARMRGRGESERGRQFAELRRQRLAAEIQARGEELPESLKQYEGMRPATEAPTMREQAWEKITPQKIEADASSYLMDTATAGERPSFDAFRKQANTKYGYNFGPGELRQVWEDSVWNSLLKATPEQLDALRKQLKLERAVGTRRIPSPESTKTFTLEFTMTKAQEAQLRRMQAEEAPGVDIGATGARGARNYRNAVISAIGRKLTGEAYEGKKNWRRKEIAPDDISVGRESAEGVFRTITREEASDPSRLLPVFSDNARVHGAPASVTRRVAVLIDNQNRVYMASVYPEGKGVLKIVHPQRTHLQRPNVTVDEAFLRRYRPIHSVLLDEPVQNFLKRFDNMEEFTAKFGGEANRSAMEFAEVLTTEEFQPGGRIATPGIFLQRRGMWESAQRPRSMTAAESGALYEHILDTTGPIKSPTGVAKAIAELERKTRDRGEQGQYTLSGRDWAALSALVKIRRQFDRAMRDRPTEEVMQAIEKQIYEDAAQSQSRSEFAQRSLARYGRAPEKVGGRPHGAAPAVRPTRSTVRTVDPTLGTLSPRQIVQPEPFELAGSKDITSLYESIAAPPINLKPARGAKVIEPGAPEFMIRREGKPLFGPRRPDVEATITPRVAPGPTGRLEPFARERGPSILNRAAEVADQFVFSPAKAFARSYSGWMSDNIRRKGGQASRYFADQTDLIIDRQKALYGEMAPLIDVAKEAAGGTFEARGRAGKLAGQLPSAARMKATAWINTIDRPASAETGISRVVPLMEGRVKGSEIVEKIMKPARAMNLAAGRLVEPVTGVKATGKFERHWTPLGYDILLQGKGKQWDAMTRDIATLNRPTVAGRQNLPDDILIERVRREFRNLNEELSRDLPDMDKVEKINQDFRRKYPVMPTHIRTATGWQQLIHTDLFNYLENTAQRATHVRAFRERFPSTPEGRKVFSNVVGRTLAELPPEVAPDVHAFLKTLQGRPTDSYNRYGVMSPGTAWNEFLRATNQTAMNLAAKMVLTGQMVTQLPETLMGPGPSMFGMKNQIRAMARLNELWPQLERNGQVNRMLYDWSINPSAPVRTSFRLAGNTISKTFAINYLNEFQGRLFASMAHVAAERIKNNSLSAFERRQLPQTMRKMQFTEKQTRRMMEGDPEMLEMFKRRAPAWLSAENKAISEGSRISANRLFNSLFRFQTYPMTKFNQFRQSLIRITEAKSGAERLAALEGMGRFLGYTAAQGAFLTLLGSFMFGGKAGIKTRLSEAQDEPVTFLGESLLGAMGGPLYLVWMGARYNGLLGVGEMATRMFFPYSVGRDAYDALSGSGSYRDMDVNDRVGKYVSQKMPGLRIGQTALAHFGLSNKNVELEQAMKGYWRWRSEEIGFGRYEENLKVDEHKEFRTAMKKAVRAIQEGDREAYATAITEAGLTGEEGWRSVAQSFRSRRLLEGLTMEELSSLEDKIGEDAVNQLTWYDNMLERAADGGELYWPD